MLAARFLIFCLLLLPLTVFAQDEADVAKERKLRRNALIEQIVAEIGNLQLRENRAISYVKAGNLVWQTDAARARSLFQTGINELIEAQTNAEISKKRGTRNNELLTGHGVRPQILQTIAARDAELALEFLTKTRPAAVWRAMSGQSAVNPKISSNSANNGYLVQNEMNLEQTFIRMAADLNPERAVKLLEESLRKGFSNATFNLLSKLNEKDPESAAKLAAEVVTKLLRRSLINENQPDHAGIYIAVAFLNDFIRDRSHPDQGIRFDDAQMRALAEKLIAFYIENAGRLGNFAHYSFVQIGKIAEKLSPSSVETLKVIQQKNTGHGFGNAHDPDLQKLLRGDVTPDQMLAEAKDFPLNSRRQIYQTAAAKMVRQGDTEGAVKVLTDNFSDDALESAIDYLNWNHVNDLINSGRFEEAEIMIDRLPEINRCPAFIQLANSSYRKNPVENKAYAMALLEKARNGFPYQPENSNQLSQLMQIISAVSKIEPADAFQQFEALIPRINEISQAAVIVNAFHGNSNVRDGEFVMTQQIVYGVSIDSSL